MKLNKIYKDAGIVEGLISEDLKSKLQVLAGVNEEDYNYTDRGIKFEFKNSLNANFCQIVEYHDKIIIELRKKANNLVEGEYNKLVYEDIIDPRDLSDVFQQRTGIYLDYI